MTRLINRAFVCSIRRLVKDSFFGTAAETTAIREHRMKFSIEKHLGKEPNKADVSIYNLAQSSRAAFERKPVQVRLDAGYDGELRLLFLGDLRYGISARDGADWVTKLQLADGDRAYSEARVSRSYAGAPLPKDIVRDIAKTMQLEVNDTVLRAGPLSVPFAKGVVVHGHARDELTRLLSPFGYTWSIQDGRLLVVQDKVGTNDNTALLIDQDAGMLGSPEFGPPPKKGKPPTLNVRTLLNAGAVPGDKVKVKSREVDGIFRIETLKHEGDTHGEDWTTTFELKPL